MILKQTGIIKRMDDLGRVQLPHEARRILQLQIGDPLEVFVADDDKIVLKKQEAKEG